MSRQTPPGPIASFDPSGSTRPAAGAASSPREVNTLPREAMSAEERVAVLRGLDDMRAGRLATDADVEAAFRRFRP